MVLSAVVYLEGLTCFPLLLLVCTVPLLQTVGWRGGGGGLVSLRFVVVRTQGHQGGKSEFSVPRQAQGPLLSV